MKDLVCSVCGTKHSSAHGRLHHCCPDAQLLPISALTIPDQDLARLTEMFEDPEIELATIANYIQELSPDLQEAAQQLIEHLQTGSHLPLLSPEAGNGSLDFDPRIAELVPSLS